VVGDFPEIQGKSKELKNLATARDGHSRLQRRFLCGEAKMHGSGKPQALSMPNVEASIKDFSCSRLTFPLAPRGTAFNRINLIG